MHGVCIDMSNYCCSCSCFFSKHTCISHGVSWFFASRRCFKTSARAFVSRADSCCITYPSVLVLVDPFSVLCVCCWRGGHDTPRCWCCCTVAVRPRSDSLFLQFEFWNSRMRTPRSSHSGRRPFLSCDDSGRQSNIHVYLVVTYTAEPSTGNSPWHDLATTQYPLVTEFIGLLFCVGVATVIGENWLRKSSQKCGFIFLPFLLVLHSLELPFSWFISSYPTVVA